MRLAVLLLLVFGCNLSVAFAHAEGDVDSTTVAVPDLRRLPPQEAVRLLLDVGLRPGRIYERGVPQGWPLGVVVQQAPAPDEDERPSRLVRGSVVRLRVSAARDGDPAGREVPAAWLVSPPPPDAPVEPAPVAALPPPTEEPALAAVPPLPVSEPAHDVPPLTGLDLVEAEQLARQRGLTLYVERVAGHPVGRVLEQVPGAGEASPPGGLVRVVVTAGATGLAPCRRRQRSK